MSMCNDSAHAHPVHSANSARKTISDDYAISIIVIGAILLIRSFPQLIRQLIVYFQQSSLPVDYSSNPASSFVVLNFIMTLIGFYFITSNRTIVSFIEKQRRKSSLKNSGQEE